MTARKPPGDPTRPGPGGARWCTEHERYECTRSRSKGRGVCHGAAIDGTAACRMHAGVRSEVAKVQGAAITAWSAAMGAEASIDPATAVLGQLQVSWLRQRLYAEQLQVQVEEQGVSTEELDAGDRPNASGLIGHTYAAAKDVGVFASGEAVRALVQLEAQERDRVVRFAKVAHDMGIAEAQTELAKAQADMMQAVVLAVFDRLALDAAQRQLAMRLLVEELERVAGGVAA